MSDDQKIHTSTTRTAPSECAAKHVVLTGFMGTGKTAVGQTVARQMDCSFVDMDAEIEARAGKTIARIFAEDGETAFRGMEAALCRELCQAPPAAPLVIATGGGTLVDPANRALIMESGTLICLSCDPDEVLQRVGADGNPDRPLLDVADPRAEVERLLKARCGAYQAIPWQIDTTGLSVEEVAAQVLHIAGFITLPVRHPGGQYEIHVGNGLLAHVGGLLRSACVSEAAAALPSYKKGSRVALVSNPVVAPLYGAQVEQALRSAGFDPFVCSIPDGEQHKTLATVAMLYEQFLAGGLDRSGTVLSLGGGVTGDVAGFAAATFMRGVRFVQVPTTLLAMVDASVGGKTGVDLPQGKNLVGAFKQPALVVVDPTVLETLPDEEIRSGMAEVIKHGIIADPALFAQLETSALQPSSSALRSPFSVLHSSPSLIARALRVKIDVVEEDPFERGRRAVLNLGHTVGHALERLSGFALRHGEAVSVGMVAAAWIAVELERADASLAERVEAVLAGWGLPVRCPGPDAPGAPSFDAESICRAMAHDKKRRGRSLRWVLPRALGEVEIAEDVPLDIVKTVLRTITAAGRLENR
jgi:shikimate kinase/3-dehydroquinate synthase